MLRGGPNISRRMIALRKPEGDRSSAAMLVSLWVSAGVGEVAAAAASAGDLIGDGGADAC